MEEKIGRETLLKLLELQIQILDSYKKVLDSPQRKEAKKAVSNILTAIIAAVPYVSALQQVAYNEVVDVHEKAVTKTRELLNDLLREEQSRAGIHDRMREEAGRGGGKD